MVTPPTIGLLSYSRPPKLDAYVAKALLFRVGPISHAAYASRHGYSLLTPFSCNTSVESIAPAEWVKVFFARACMKALPHMEWFVWVDADAIIATSVRLEDEEGGRIAMAFNNNKPCSLSLPADWKHEEKGGVNTGVLLIHNDASALSLLDRLALSYQKPSERTKRFPEQRALTSLLLTSPAVVEDKSNNLTIRRLPTGSGGYACIHTGERRRAFFSLVEPSVTAVSGTARGAYEPAQGHQYRQGDFIAHFSGGSPPFPPWSEAFVRGWMSRLGLRDAWDAEARALKRERGRG